MSLISLLFAFTNRPSSRRSRRSSANPNRANRRRLLLEGLEGRQMLTFSAAVDYPADSSPQAIVSSDFNNDGNLDLATTAGYAAGKVSVRLGNGAGGFGTAQVFDSGWWDISSIAVADFNRDTKVDIVVAHMNGCSILMGNGDGTFQSAVTPQLGDLTEVAVGDFNNDSNIDLFVAWYHWELGRHYDVQLGNGQGGFTLAPGNAFQGEGGLATVDLYNDGKLDVVTADGRVLLGIGNGKFFDYGQQPLVSGQAVATGDFTGEGNVDLVVAGDNVLAVLPSIGEPIYHSANGTVHTAVATADFNADGKLDAIVTDSDKATVSVMLGNGDGTLRYAGAFATGTSPSGIAVGDFNRDGWPDLAVANAGSNTVSVLLNDGAWSSVPPPPPSIRIHDVSVSEGNAGAIAAAFTMTLSAASTEMITVAYATGNGTASADGDYQAVLGMLTFAPGETNNTITVLVNGDRLGEPNETFFVNLSSPTNATIADTQGVGTIRDDEPRISISDMTMKEGKKNQKTLFTFTVTLSAAYDQAVTMSFRTVNGTATTGNNDYIAKSGTLTFAPGETTKTITIEVKGDSKKESNETFYLDLFGLSSNALFTKNRGLGTIVNDD